MSCYNMVFNLLKSNENGLTRYELKKLTKYKLGDVHSATYLLKKRGIIRKESGSNVFVDKYFITDKGCKIECREVVKKKSVNVKSKLYDNILQLIKKTNGIQTCDIVKETKNKYSIIKFHLKKLRDEGLVSSDSGFYTPVIKNEAAIENSLAVKNIFESSNALKEFNTVKYLSTLPQDEIFAYLEHKRQEIRHAMFAENILKIDSMANDKVDELRKEIELLCIQPQN